MAGVCFDKEPKSQYNRGLTVKNVAMDAKQMHKVRWQDPLLWTT